MAWRRVQSWLAKGLGGLLVAAGAYALLVAFFGEEHWMKSWLFRAGGGLAALALFAGGLKLWSGPGAPRPANRPTKDNPRNSS